MARSTYPVPWVCPIRVDNSTPMPYNGPMKTYQATVVDDDVDVGIDLGTGLGMGIETWDDSASDLDGPWQVVIYNDEVNSMDFVVQVLMKVFGHTHQLAEKIMMEIHTKGRSVAEVEDREKAVLHKQQLISYGLTADAEAMT